MRIYFRDVTQSLAVPGWAYESQHLTINSTGFRARQ